MILEPSAWTYITGATGGGGIAFVAAGGGAIWLTDPGQRTYRFIYGGIGAGLSLGFRIPRVPKVAVRGRSVAGAGSLTPFPSTGAVFRSPALGRELTVADIQGAVVFGELGGGLVAGASGTAMLFGMNSMLLLAGIASTTNPALMARALAGATGAVVFAGVNVGVQAGGGVAGMVGYMR